MKRLIGTGVFIVVLGVIFVLSYMEKPADDTQQVLSEAHIVLTDSGFEPSEITVRRGSVVTFSNETGKPFWPASNLHPTHELYSEFDPDRPLEPDETFVFQFDRLGEHNYHDHIRSYFIGVIHVVE